MGKDTMKKMNYNLFAVQEGLRAEVALLKTKLASIKAVLQNGLIDVEDALKIEYTGWYVFLRKRKDGGWECVSCCDPYSDEVVSDDFDVCLAIPKPESLAEFDGF